MNKIDSKKVWGWVKEFLRPTWWKVLLFALLIVFTSHLHNAYFQIERSLFISCKYGSNCLEKVPLRYLIPEYLFWGSEGGRIQGLVLYLIRLYVSSSIIVVSGGYILARTASRYLSLPFKISKFNNLKQKKIINTIFDNKWSILLGIIWANASLFLWPFLLLFNEIKLFPLSYFIELPSNFLRGVLVYAVSTNNITIGNLPKLWSYVYSAIRIGFAILICVIIKYSIARGGDKDA